MFGRIKKEEYEKVVHANNELRMKMEKLRLENALLRDQIRAMSKLSNEEGLLYSLIQTKNSISIDEIKSCSEVKSLKPAQITKNLNALVNRGIIDKIDSGGTPYYSIKTPDASGGSISQNESIVHSSEFGTTK